MQRFLPRPAGEKGPPGGGGRGGQEAEAVGLEVVAVMVGEVQTEEEEEKVASRERVTVGRDFS